MRRRNEKGEELGGVGYKTLRYKVRIRALKWSLRDTGLRWLLLVSPSVDIKCKQKLHPPLKSLALII
jgi:hypothetical protein